MSASSATSASSSSNVTNSDKPFVDPEAGLGPPEFTTHPQPLNPEREKFRDFQLGPFTLHRFFLLLFLAGVTIGFYFLQDLIWPPSDERNQDTLWTLLGIVWLIPLPGAILWIMGAMYFRYNTRLDDVEPVPYNVSLRIVSRGSNAECLLSTIRHSQAAMQKTPMFPYIVEVVTDGDCFTAPCEPDVLHTRVPIAYQPPNGSRFKARALHYACEYSRVPFDTWVVHLDEESQLTGSVIKGIADMISKCERGGNVRRVGQGMILYHRSWGTHPFLTLADMRRTGDDLGHFHLQHQVGRTIFGLHGSFVVARADVEREIGFDVGPRGSITEDAWWILLAMEKGIRTMWVDGYIEEQSTQSLTDFLKQRRRWYVGLFKVVWFAPVGLRHRWMIMFMTFTWGLTPVIVPLQVVYLVLSLIYEKHIIPPIRIATTLVMATWFALNYTGLVINMREHGTPAWRGLLWIIALTLLLPAFYIMEFVSVVMALLSPLSQNAKGFHVVQKSGTGVDSDTVTDTESTD